MKSRMSGRFTTEDCTDPVLGSLRRCTFCGYFKPMRDFGLNGIDHAGNAVRRLDCKQCFNIRRKENRSRKAHNDFVGGMKRRGEEEVVYTHQDWKEVLIFFGGECAYCGGTPRKGQKLTKDHLIPVGSCGKTIPENIIPACSKCNSSKGAEEMKAWYMKQSFFSQERLNKIFKWRTIMRLL